MVGSPEGVVAWRPDVAGITEVFHARFVDHAYPPHTHAAWTLLIVDDGAVRYDLDRHEHGALRPAVTLLPPHVPHDGRAASAGGFRKRVLYLTDDVVGPHLGGHAVDRPAVVDPLLRHRIDQLHGVLASPGDELDAASRLALIGERLRAHLLETPATPPRVRDPGLAHRLRDLLDAHITSGITLDDAAALLHAHPTHLVRAFGREFGLPPHRYLIGRRVDLARTLLLDGHPAARVAAAAGFHDQPHLVRHFRRLLGTSPGRFAAPARATGTDNR